MLYTIVNYTCTSETQQDGSSLYKLFASVADKGELPYAAIFVYNIVKTDRVSSDTFARVANPHDLQVLKPDRFAAIAGGQTTYLANLVELSYPTVEVAAQAKIKLTERINDLAKGHITYMDEFKADNESYAFPNSAQNVNEALKIAYQEAVNARAEATATLSAAILDVNTSQTNLNHAQALVDAWYYSVKFLKKDSTPEVDVPGDRGFIPLLNNYHNRLVAEVDEPPDAGSIWGNVPGTIIYDVNEYLAYCQSQLTYWRNQRNAYKGDYSDAVDARIAAESEVRQTTKEETKAKADILAVCPSFDFNTL